MWADEQSRMSLNRQAVERRNRTIHGPKFSIMKIQSGDLKKTKVEKSVKGKMCL